MRVENRHEGLGAHSLAGVFLSHHESHVLRIVLKVIYEGLALASYGLSGKDTAYISLLSKSDTNYKMKIAREKQRGNLFTSDEAECCGLALIPHLLRIVLASRW